MFAPHLAFVHVQGLCSQGQLPLCSTDGALQEALLLLQLAHHLQLGVDLVEEDTADWVSREVRERAQSNGAVLPRLGFNIRGRWDGKNMYILICNPLN